MNNEILHITNGECFNEHLILKCGVAAVPFCEAMMDGEAATEIYSDSFVTLRANALNVTEDRYRGKMYVYDALREKEYRALSLWFGKDSFCQVNLLTLLAYLEQIQYDGKVKLNYIDDESFALLESHWDVRLGIYKKIYEDVLILKRIPEELGVLNPRAIALYFDYRWDQGALASLVRANAHMDRTELIGLLLEQSKDYGLSDLQAEQLINTHRPKADKAP